MKKFIAICLSFLMIFTLFGCNNKDSWENEDNYADVINPNEVVIDDEDMNLSGKLYTEENKPEGAEPIVVYTLAKDKLTVEKHTSYALPEKINIQYLMDTLTAFSAENKFKIKADIIDDTATITIPSEESLVSWLAVVYPNDIEKYNPAGNCTDVSFNAPGFAMAAMEAIQRTICENLNVKTVIFRTSNGFLNLGGNCKISDGVYFNSDCLPLYYASQYNYYGDKSYEDLCEEYAGALKNTELPNEEAKVEAINKLLNSNISN